MATVTQARFTPATPAATPWRTVKMTVLEETELYLALKECTKKSLEQALRVIDQMDEKDILLKSQTDGNTFLHILVGLSDKIYQVNKDLTPANPISSAIPLIYKLALAGIDVNIRNHAGNTCLHIACFKPHADKLLEHLIRIGVDPCLINKKGCKVVHNFSSRACQIVKGQPGAKSGFWSAVDREDLVKAEMYLKAWARTNPKRATKTLKIVCEDTGSHPMMSLLQRYEPTNEMVCAAMACDARRVAEMLEENGKYININTEDHSQDVPKPLMIYLKELGSVANGVVKVLTRYGANDGSTYWEKREQYERSFEESDLYQLLEDKTKASLLRAIDLTRNGQVNVKLKSFKENTKGWTYLHYICDLYKTTDDFILKRLLLRLIYTLALAGIDVNVRDASDETALMKAFDPVHQELAYNMLRIGVDASIATGKGKAVSITNYTHKGKLVVEKGYRRIDQPGLWVAVEDQDIRRVRQWLNSWARVNVMKNDRALKDVARATGTPESKEILGVLEQHEHTNEFVAAVFSCDMARMKKLLALGKGICECNPVDHYYIAGYKPDLSAEYVSRPLIIPAFEVCTPDVVEFLIRFDADLGKPYEECAPCGPAAFWAFRDDIYCQNTLVVAHHADVRLRDERGATMLHRAIKMKYNKLKVDIVKVLLDRKINIAARDIEGLTARDYLDVYDIDQADVFRNIIDEFIVFMVTDDQQYHIEELVINGYDHILDIEGVTKKGIKKTIRELTAEKQLNDMLKLLDDIPEYQRKIDAMHNAVANGDIAFISKHAEEKRIAWGVDKGGRSLMHKAIMYQNLQLVDFLNQQFPKMALSKDNLLRIPMHYDIALMACADKKLVGKMKNILAPAGGMDLRDVNNMTVNDYLREIENPTPKKEKPRGRQEYDYRVADVISIEKERKYDMMTDKQTPAEETEKQTNES